MRLRGSSSIPLIASASDKSKIRTFATNRAWFSNSLPAFGRPLIHSVKCSRDASPASSRPETIAPTAPVSPALPAAVFHWAVWQAAR